MSESATETREAWARVIRAERTQRKLNQDDVAAMTGLDQTTVSKAELGRASLETLVTIAKALNVELPAPEVKAS